MLKEYQHSRSHKNDSLTPANIAKHPQIEHGSKLVSPADAPTSTTTQKPTNLDRRDFLYTFLDQKEDIFTVTNVPDRIHLPSAVHYQPDENLQYKDILRPQFANLIAPELGFVLRTIPVNDPLLGRLGADNSWLAPVEFKHRFGLHDDIRASWWQLEKALLLISNLLISLGNTDESKVLHRCTFWKDPSDCGYRRLHATYGAAMAVIRNSRTALAVLAARCSMAITLLLDDEPRHVPTWVTLLRNNGVPECWIDILLSSVITDFSHNLRVGVVLNPKYCSWTRLLTCYRRARVPVIVHWEKREDIALNMYRVPYLSEFAPDPRNSHILRPPRAEAPNVYLLCRDGQGKPHPFDAGLEARLQTKPAGQFQLAGESVQQFRQRMNTMTDRIIARESRVQREARERRQRAADAGGVPPPWVRVFVWMKLPKVMPDCPQDWEDLDYRVLALSSQYRDLWATHPPSTRVYNAVFNEWDLCMWQDAQLPNARQHVDREPADMPTYQNDDELYTSIERDIIPRIDPAALRSPVLFDDSHLYTTYGLSVSTVTYPGDRTVEYKDERNKYLHRFFGLVRPRDLTHSDAVRRVYAAWQHQIITHGASGTATQDCWDLHYPSHQFMITSQIKDKIQVRRSKDTAGNTVYLVRYAEDPRPAPWTLVVRPIVLANLLRNFPGIANSVDAVIHCVSIGAPFHTVLAIRTADIPVPSAAHQRNRVRAPVLYRYGESADKVKMWKSDYHAARIRALAVLGDTQIRGALSEGGILWRLAREILSVDGDVYYGAINICTRGPLLHGGMSTLVHVFPESNGISYVDNGMTDSEAGILWGRYQRYCSELTFIAPANTSEQLINSQNEVIRTLLSRSCPGGLSQRVGMSPDFTPTYGTRTMRTISRKD